MNTLFNRRILLGVTGGIAAYKSAELIRLLKSLNADVRVVMTKAAQEFITPLTLQALSANPVHTDLLDTEAERAMGHIELAKWADLILVAPASADFIARLRHGMADDLLTTLCLATESQVAIAPAMNQAMWGDSKTQENMDALKKHGCHILGPGVGAQACGDFGPGRMLDVETLAGLAAGLFESTKLNGLRITITAGPTQEAIDPVRYISNQSSGKMGFAIAKAASEAGAEVTLIAGPVNLETPDRVARIDVINTKDMLTHSLSLAAKADIFIGCAAVSDYRPEVIAEHKIKKSEDTLTIKLVKNPDIIACVAQLEDRPFMVGFAAETENLIEHAKRKLARKKLDMIVANDVSVDGMGFGSDHNAVSIMTPKKEYHITKCSKTLVAEKLIDILIESFAESGTRKL